MMVEFLHSIGWDEDLETGISSCESFWDFQKSTTSVLLENMVIRIQVILHSSSQPNWIIVYNYIILMLPLNRRGIFYPLWTWLLNEAHLEPNDQDQQVQVPHKNQSLPLDADEIVL